MADKRKEAAATAPPSPEPDKKKRFRVFKFLLIIFVLIILAGGSFAVGVFLNLVDMPKLAEQYKLYDYPVVGKYFPKPVPNIETIEFNDDSLAQQPAAAQPDQTMQPAAPPPMVLNDTVDKELMAKSKAEEAKRIGKMARLYGGMKPEEAVNIIKELDDPTVVAIFSKMEEEQVSKIMALLDTRRAAKLTQDMLKGRPQ